MTHAAHPTITLLQTSSLASVVHAELERMILSGEFAPGAKLPEAALAAQLGVSRGPLREAFRTLDEAGLVRTEKNRGVYVRDVPVDEAIEIFDLRAAMDELVGRRLATQITAPQLKELRGLVEQMELTVKAHDLHRYHALNLGFHDRLVELAGNRKLTSIYRRLVRELSLFRCKNLSGDGLLPASASAHRQIVKAIASGDADAAGRVMFEHASESKERTIRNNPMSSDTTASATPVAVLASPAAIAPATPSPSSPRPSARPAPAPAPARKTKPRATTRAPTVPGTAS